MMMMMMLLLLLLLLLCFDTCGVFYLSSTIATEACASSSCAAEIITTKRL